jgi:hypothetical protein
MRMYEIVRPLDAVRKEHDCASASQRDSGLAVDSGLAHL